MAKDPSDPYFAVHPRRKRKPRIGALLAGAALLAYVVLAWLVLPDLLPNLVQKLLGLGCAALAATVFLLATRDRETPEEALYQLRRGQSSDFGKRLRKQRRPPRKVQLPLLGEVRARSLVAVGVFLVVFLWWLTPVAPVGVQPRTYDDLTVPIGEQLAMASFCWPGACIAVLAPPEPPPEAVTLARRIPDDADPYLLGLKAMAEGRFQAASKQFNKAMSENGGPPGKIEVARAQNQMLYGQYAEAATWYGSALEHSPDDPMLLCQAAAAWIYAGDYKRARTLLDKARKIVGGAEAPGGVHSTAQAACLHLDAVLSVFTGDDVPQSLDTCHQAMQLLEQSEQPDAELLAASVDNNQASVNMLLANYAAAEVLFQSAATEWKKTRQADDPVNVAAALNLAMLRCRQGACLEASDLVEQVAGRLEKQKETDAFTAALLQAAQGATHCALGRFADGEKAARAALDQFVATAGEEDPTVVATLDILARTEAGIAHFTLAQLHSMRAISQAEALWGPEHPYLAPLYIHLAGLYVVEGRFAEASGPCDLAIGIVETHYGPDHPLLADALCVRARIAVGQGDPRAARPELERALEIREKVFGRKHPCVARTQGELAGLDHSSRMYGTGVDQLQAAIEATKESLGPEHPQVADLLIALAELHGSRAAYGPALTALDEALAVRRAVLVPYHPAIADTLDAQAAALLAMEQPDQQRAAALKSQAEQIRAQHRKEDRSQ